MTFVDVLGLAELFVRDPYFMAALATLAGLLTAAGTQIWMIHAARREANEVAFQQALDSDDLNTVGRYLNDKLGAIDLISYGRDSKTRSKVNSFVEKLASFVEAPADDQGPTQEEEEWLSGATVASSTARGTLSASGDEIPFQIGPDEPEVFRSAVADLRRGDSWSTLARLRRDFEMRLRELLGDEPNPIGVTSRVQPRILGLRQMVELLDDRISKQSREAIIGFSQTANRAIHGLDVSLTEAMHAINLAREAYRELDAKRPVKASEGR